MDHTCNNCEYGIFCPTWAEMKCKKFLSRNEYAPNEINNCEEWKKRLSSEEPKCHCDDCMQYTTEE